MSILIKDMEMPKNCDKCKFSWWDVGHLYCEADGKPWSLEVTEYAHKRHPDCPFIEVPPHGRLIDADELMRRIQLYIDEYELYVDDNGFHCKKWCAMKETEMAINDAPTVVSADKDGET